MRRERPAGARLGTLVGAVLKPAVARHGFGTSEVMLRWAELVGPRFAGVTQPLRVVWPRRAAALPEDAAPVPATLVVRCEGAHALDLQFAAPVVLERVNSLFGWRAVEKLSIRQGPVTRQVPPPAHGDPPAAPAVESLLAGVEDDALRTALGRLGRGMLADKTCRRR